MKTTFSFLCAIFVCTTISFSQNNAIVINDNAFLVMNGGVFIVVDQPHQDGIITLGTGGHIVSEDENNKIRWEIANNTGVYTVPFTSTPSIQGGNETKIPFTLQIQSAGVGASGRVDFSTYETSTDMNVPWASTVTHMNDADMVATDNSLFVADRFWFIDANNYATKPDPVLTFGYDDNANEIGGTNTITEANLVAQRFDDGNGTWGGDFFNSVNFWGTANIATDLVSGVDVDASNFFAAWVLVNKSSILPVELTNFEGNCMENGVIELNWSTASELNNNYFTIEKSMDGLSWSTFKVVEGAGNSTEQQNYFVSDGSPFNSTYYRIKQTDFDGGIEILKTINVLNCGFGDGGITVIVSANGEISIKINSSKSDNYTITLFDMRGRKVSDSQIVETIQGENIVSLYKTLSFGLYTVVVENDYQTFVKKIALN